MTEEEPLRLASFQGDAGALFAASLALREEVFCEEQGVPPELERDALDGVATHVVLLEEPADEGVAAASPPRAVATARVLVEDTVAKVQRVAVARARRGTGLGRRIMEAAEELARQAGAAKARLASQVTAIPFYERLGYRARGPVFQDAGLDHRWMDKALR